jgi:Tfp pilus assembly PilM family ATPase
MSLSYGLGVDFERAEALKRNFGLERKGINGKKICEITIPLADIIVSEIEKMMRYYSSKRDGQVKKIILTGGSANLKGLDSYVSKKLGLAVERGNPWKGLSYPNSLSPVLREIAPSFSVAVGLATAGFERK